MRLAFVKTILKLSEKDKNIYLLVGDLGFSVFEDFKKKFPDRFINCGVAEQNMMGVAAGLAMSGKKVIVYSIIPFVTMRCFEQIRNDICLQNLNVKIVGVGGGMSYGQQGPTHHALEDIAIFRAIPNMTILVPSDPVESELATKEMIKLSGPVYLRIGKSKEELINIKPFKFKIGTANIIRKGRDIVFFVAGPIIKNVLIAADLLKKSHGLSSEIISMHSLRPLDEKIIREKSKKAKAIFSVEEHYIVGGLGEAISAVLAELILRKSDLIFKRIGITGEIKAVGDQNYLRDICGLSPEKIKLTVEKSLKLNNGN